MEIFPFEEVNIQLRQLAKKDYWQSIYAQSKEVGGINIFHNSREFTYYQLAFLNHLAFYSALYFDIATNEVSDMVLQCELYEDAYWHYRTEKRLAKTKRANKPTGEHGTFIQKVREDKEEITNKNLWAFTKAKRQ